MPELSTAASGIRKHTALATENGLKQRASGSFGGNPNSVPDMDGVAHNSQQTQSCDMCPLFAVGTKACKHSRENVSFAESS